MTGRVVVLCVLTVAAFVSLLQGLQEIAIVSVAGFLTVGAPPVVRRLRQRLEVRRISGELSREGDGSRQEGRWRWSPMECLAEIGLDRRRSRDILRASRHGDEVVLAELDKKYRLLSHVGEIPLFGSWLITEREFEKQTNRTEIVAVDGVVAFRKQYADHGRLRNEVHALDALRDVPGVPRLLDLERERRIAYQSFVPGRNLGGMLAQHGVSVDDQSRLDRGYPGPGQWRPGDDGFPRRRAAVETLRELVDAAFLRDLGRLVQTIHDAGVAIRDIKHGNVLVVDGSPFVCDFDSSTVALFRGRRFERQRREDLDRLRFLFGEEVFANGGARC